MNFHAFTRFFVAAAALLALPAASLLSSPVLAQGTGPSATASSTMPSLYGFWNDNGWHVFLSDSPAAVTATYFTDVDCDLQDGSGTVEPYVGNLDFSGSISGVSIDGQTQTCRFGSDQPNPGPGMSTMHLDLTDPNTLSGYWIGADGNQEPMTVVRLVDNAPTTPLPTNPPGPTAAVPRPTGGAAGGNPTSQVGPGPLATPTGTPPPGATPTPPSSSGGTTPGGILIANACSVVTTDEIASALGIQVDQPTISAVGPLTICAFPILSGSGSVIVSFATNVPTGSGMKDGGTVSPIGSGSGQINTVTGSKGTTQVAVEAPASLVQLQALLNQILEAI